MQYHLASLNLPLSSSSNSPSGKHDAKISVETLRLKADEHLSSVLHQNRLPTTVKDASHISFLETPIGVAILTLVRCLESLSHPRYSENESILAYLRKWWKPSVQLVASAVQRIQTEDAETSRMDADGCEVLYGRAGFLYGLLCLRKAAGKAREFKSFKELEESQREEVEMLISDEQLQVVIESLVVRGQLGAKHYARELGDGPGVSVPPLMWMWYGKRYLGGAHGVVGILQMMLSCPAHLIQSHIGDIMSTIEWLSRLQTGEGNWPSKAPRGRRSVDAELIQWCHGAPGVLILLATVLRLGSENDSATLQLSDGLRESFTVALKNGANLVYEKGLLRKGVGLCHGVSGSVYALLAVSGVLDNPGQSETYFKRAVHLAHLGTFADEFVKKGEMSVPDRPMSLYEGLAGMCCAWGEIISRLKEGGRRRDVPSGMPGYDDLVV
ncbi:lanthionine synthetase C-like protein [Coprinopsis sp. MPI-PUGE-AT-0042]|nr:lanthionine synthetase C-like protein [Coprinopsis sp. MPI-PUGE-AT-0042]